MQRRCMTAGCPNWATNAHSVSTPSVGYPLKNGSKIAKLFLAFFVCDDHAGTLSAGDVLHDEAREVISAAFVSGGVVPDFNRTSIKPVPLTDSEWLRFEAAMKKNKRAA